MPRLMSFALTTQQIIDKSKTVTRRMGWGFLKPGDTLFAVDKVMGFKRGEKPRHLGMIRVVSVRREPLNLITPEDVAREGFPDWTPAQFVEMVQNHYRVAQDVLMTRIKFEHLEKYRPSNGMEGDAFIDATCTGCKRLRDGYCGIQSATLWCDTDDPNYPWQWQTNSAGVAWCTAFNDGRKATAAQRCKLTLDMFDEGTALM